MQDRDAPHINRSPEEREEHRPRQRVSAPVRSRHALERINRNSKPKELNSVVMPGINTGRETEMIRQGYGDSLGNNRWRINGRVYVREGNDKGTLYPESGEGVQHLSRNEFAALVLLIRHGGYNVNARREIAHKNAMTDDVVQVARALFDLRPKK